MNAVEVLTKHNLIRTSCREGIIEAMLLSDSALSEKEIKERLTGHYDRTTFYRSFKTLQEKHIIHKIVVNNQLAKYALDKSADPDQKHVHFYCPICNSVKCLDTIPVSTPELPDGFTARETEMIIRGSCDICNDTNKE